MLSIDELDSRVHENLGKKLEPWQKEVVEDEHRKLVLKCGRKCGKTYCLCFKVAYYMLTREFGNSHGILYLSKGQKQSKEAINEIKDILSAYGIEWTNQRHKVEGNVWYGATEEIKAPNGNRVLALPAGHNADNLRPYSFYIIVYDEDAFMPDQIHISTSPCLAVYGVQEIYASTPKGMGDSFHLAWKDPKASKYSRITQQCDRVSKEWLLQQKKELGELNYQQEYEGLFLDHATGFFPSHLITSCTVLSHDWDMGKHKEQAAFTTIGVDFAEMGKDKSVIVVNYWFDNTSHIHVDAIYSKTRTTDVAAKILHTIKHKVRDPYIVVTDEGGVGVGATEILSRELGAKHVMGIKNQNVVEHAGERKWQKTAMYMEALRLMEEGKVKFWPFNKLTNSLRSVRYDHNKRGELLIHGYDNHAAEAFVRALLPVCKKNPIKIHFGSFSHDKYGKDVQEEFINTTAF